MKVFRYNQYAANLIEHISDGAIKSQPWLHVVFVVDVLNTKTYWAVYVWDTRRVVKEGVANADYSALLSASNMPKAVDNHQSLVGSKLAPIAAAFDNRVFGVDTKGNAVATYKDRKNAYAKVGKDKQVVKVISAEQLALDKPEQYLKQ